MAYFRVFSTLSLAFFAACTTAELRQPGQGGPGNSPATSSDSDGGTTDSDGAAPGNPDDPDAVAPPPSISMDVTILVEPSDNAAGLISAIGDAQTSVHVTMYLFSSTSVQNALIAAKQRGLEVKVLLNKTFPANAGSNTTAFNAFKNAGIDVAWAPAGYTLTHEKCFIFDAKTAWIMTMNTTQSSPSQNREFLAIDKEPADVAEAEAIFAADFANQPLHANDDLVVAPTNATKKLKGLTDSAKTSIDVEGEVLSDTTITSALTARADAGVPVRIVLSDEDPTPAQQTAIDKLKMHNVPVVKLSKPYIHAKAIVVDGDRAYVGSENFTTASLQYNRELGVIFGAPAEVKKVADTIDADFKAGTAL